MPPRGIAESLHNASSKEFLEAGKRRMAETVECRAASSLFGPTSGRIAVPQAP